ncbi:EspA/EspE family type VII secretion system effector [Mycolicibacterium sp. XJ1819]
MDDARTARQALDGTGSVLLNCGQAVIGAMKRTTGDGDPDTGALFSHAHSRFNRVGQALRTARPDDSWVGRGASTYADQNARQQLRAETMARADREVHRVLYRQATQIAERRRLLTDQSNWLTDTGRTLGPLQLMPRYGEAARLAVEVNALQRALGESTDQMSRLWSEVRTNAGELRQAVGRYAGVADGAGPDRAESAGGQGGGADARR